MTQHGFFFDQSRCSGCRACAVACKNWNGLPAGPRKYLRIYEYEKGVFPDVRLHYQWVPCYHCEDPACVSSCPCDAISKGSDYGAVLVDQDKCDGCRLCYDSCPYGAIVFESDEPGAKADKCNMCVDRLRAGDQPVCVSACPSRALDFGPFSAIRDRYGVMRDLEDMPDSATTKPAVVFKPHADKRRLVAYDAGRARELLTRRDPLPPVCPSAAHIIKSGPGLVGNDRLVLKHDSVSDLMERTRGNEG